MGENTGEDGRDGQGDDRSQEGEAESLRSYSDLLCVSSSSPLSISNPDPTFMQFLATWAKGLGAEHSKLNQYGSPGKTKRVTLQTDRRTDGPRFKRHELLYRVRLPQ